MTNNQSDTPTQDDPTPLTPVARLYIVKRGERIIRRASVLSGDGEPLVRLVDAERQLSAAHRELEAERAKNAAVRDEILEQAARVAYAHDRLGTSAKAIRAMKGTP